jgi:outer membrane receptor protein involved in Fe transport
VVPAVVWNAEIALDHALTSIGATLTTGIFFQRDTDLIEPAGNTPPAIIDNLMVSQAENIGSSNEIGVEAGLRGKTAGGLRWNASYRYASISQNITAAAAADPGPSADYARGTPLHELVAGVGTTQGKWEMDVQGRWQSSYVDYRFVSPGVHAPFKVGNYVTFNARVGYQVTDYLTVAATAEQFNLSRILETSGNYVNRQCIASATLKY